MLVLEVDGTAVAVTRAIMTDVAQRAEQMTLGPLDHDTSIRIASRSPARAFLAVTGAVVLLWFLAAMSGCSSIGTGGTAGTGGNPGTGGAAGTGGGSASDGPVLTACPADLPAAGTACEGSFTCSYGQVRCCDHLEPAFSAYCQLGRIAIGRTETACELGFVVCPADGGGSDATDGAAPDAAAPDTGVCCPPDQVRSSCMNIGGYSAHGCLLTCDFFCSTNWRLENDSHGCPIWRYDTRAPAPGEDWSCFPRLDGGSPG